MSTTPTPAPEPQDVGIDAFLDEIGGMEAEPVEATPTPVAEETPATPAPTTPPVAAQPTAAVPAQPAQAPAPQPVAQPVAQPAAAAPVAQPAPAAEPVEVVRQRSIDEIAQSITFTKEQQEALMLSDEGARVLATLSAQSTVRTYENVMASVVQLLPQMVRHIVAAQNENQRVWDEFFANNKHLAEHKAKVFEIADTYRRTNSQIPVGQLMSEIAALASSRLNLAPVPAEPTVQAPIAQPPRPVAPTGPPRPPVAPAAVGAPPATQPGGEVNAFWQELADAAKMME